MYPPNAVPCTVYEAEHTDNQQYRGFLLNVTSDNEGVWAIVHDKQGYLRPEWLTHIRLGHHPTAEEAEAAEALAKQEAAAANESPNEGAVQ